jgi:protein-S-isoprenylcysteine O-methyltransferase Ste14
MEKKTLSPQHVLSHILLAVFVIAQVLLTFLLFNQNGNVVVRTIGWVVLVLSGIFGWLPIYELRRKGGVPKRASYVRTTVLVTSGIFSIVRHPQFLGGMLLGISLAFIAQHWVVIVLGVPVVIIFSLGVIDGDKEGVEKFGDDYKAYMREVPRINFVAGIIRLLIRKVKP